MFGMGGSEIIVILIVALLFLGPDKLPQAAKSLSKGIRDIKKQSRALQNQIESDEQIGGAIRDLKSALRGEELPVRPKPFTPRPQGQLAEGAGAAGAGAAGAVAAIGDGGGDPAGAEGAAGDPEGAGAGAAPITGGVPSEPAPVHDDADEAGAAPALTLPATAGEPDPVDHPEDPEGAGGGDLASMIKPASGTVAKGS